jgi:dienelactone hydrolase
MSRKKDKEIFIQVGNEFIKGLLNCPDDATGIVIFVHGSGSSRLSPRNKFVADILIEANFATLLMDLLTEDEELVDIETRHFRFDLELLTKRLLQVTEFIRNNDETKLLKIGYFGSSTGAAAAIMAGVEKNNSIAAIVSRGGRPDLAAAMLPKLNVPTLFIIGGKDEIVIDLNKMAYDLLQAEKRMEIVPEATHLFEEPGALPQVAKLARDWFKKYL